MFGLLGILYHVRSFTIFELRQYCNYIRRRFWGSIKGDCTEERASLLVAKANAAPDGGGETRKAARSVVSKGHNLPGDQYGLWRLARQQDFGT